MRASPRRTRGPDAPPAPPQFLTFCSFTWQLVVWALAVLTDVVRAPSRSRALSRARAARRRARATPRRALTPAPQATLLRRAGGAGCKLSAFLDDAACAALPIATSVTLLYYALLTANPGFVEEPCVTPHMLPMRH